MVAVFHCVWAIQPITVKWSTIEALRYIAILKKDLQNKKMCSKSSGKAKKSVQQRVCKTKKSCASEIRREVLAA